ncbi:MAG TPA: class I adenylate-forming enzyme family protein [Xanthobacteraceae bacterium]
MILDDLPQTPIAGDASLDDLFRRAAARRPDAIALIDPPNRASFTDGAPRRLTYGEADRAISAIAGRLRELNLRADAVVALQLANTVDSVLAFMAALRAELIAMPMPLLWRRAEIIGALRRASVSAMVVSGRISATDHFDLAVNAAAEAFTVRHVCGFGLNPPDGAVSLDDLCAAAGESRPGARASERAPASGRGAHVACITWDVSADGPVPLARSDAQLIAGGLAALLESRMPQDAVILSTMPLSSFGGIAMTLVPWLLVGGTLALHHPFDGATFAQQCRELACDVVIVPGPLVSRLAAAGYLSAQHPRNSVFGIWRAPEKLRRAAPWQELGPALIDVQLFGEIGLVAARRGPDGRPAPVPFGPLRTPRDADGALTVAELARTPDGTLALRGPMVPRHPFPPGAQRSTFPSLTAAADGFVDTGWACEADTPDLAVSGPPPGLVSFGGYRFAVGELAAIVSGLDPTGTLAVLPDALAGHRLDGTATNRQAIRLALRGIGANPLVVEAFGARPTP